MLFGVNAGIDYFWNKPFDKGCRDWKTQVGKSVFTHVSGSWLLDQQEEPSQEYWILQSLMLDATFLKQQKRWKQAGSVETKNWVAVSNICFPPLGEDSHFDSYFSNGPQPPKQKKHRKIEGKDLATESQIPLSQVACFGRWSCTFSFSQRRAKVVVTDVATRFAWNIFFKCIKINMSSN